MVEAVGRKTPTRKPGLRLARRSVLSASPLDVDALDMQEIAALLRDYHRL
jgi:hypothetical protein